MLLLFLDEHADAGWWRLDAAGRRVASGAALDEAVPLPGELVVAAAPASEVALHRVSLPPLAPAQAAAAARAMAMDLSAQGSEQLHVAVGADEVGARWLAVVDGEAMAGWAARVAGFEVGVMVPAALLLPPGSQAVWGDLRLVHTNEAAFAAEPELAALMVAEMPPLVALETLGDGLAARVAGLPNLMAGRFARQQPWRPAAGRVRRLGLVAAAAAVVMLGAAGVQLWQLGRAADAAEAVAAREAAALLPPGTLIEAPAAQVQARLRALGGGGGVSALLGPVLAALEARPGVAIVSLEKVGGQALVLVLQGASAGDVAGIAADLRAAGMSVEAGLPRIVAGEPMVEIKVRTL